MDNRLQQLQQQYGIRCAVEITQPDTGLPFLGMDESYQLQTTQGAARLSAPTSWGALRGLASLQQLLSGQPSLPDLLIEDAPRFAWRGLLLDVARHFIPLSQLQDVLEGMFILKLNVLHLHLTDDQAVRFASRGFPKLASRQSYSFEELRELVNYAADRGIRVVPEYDVPGHVSHWLHAYPQLAPAGYSAKPTDRFGVHPACMDPTSEGVYSFLASLFAESAEVFGDQYLHLGGDEVHSRWWQDSPAIQDFMQQHAMDQTIDLQNYFNGRVCQLLNDLGKTAVGWDEVLHPQMPALLVQNWRGATTRDRALAAGRDCLVSAGYYLDLFYPAEWHYRYDPELPQEQLLALEDEWQMDMRMAHVAAGVEWTKQWRQEAVVLADTKAQVLGGEACLWSELVDQATLPSRLWSRLPAVAERLWSPADVCDLGAFYERLQTVLNHCFGHQRQQQTDLAQLGLSDAQIDLAMLLEPVKWYARLLGEEALAARLSGTEMPQARPYDVHSPLNRVVDFLSPESLAARTIVDTSDEKLQRLAEDWSQLSVQDWPPDMSRVVVGMQAVGQLMSRYFAQEIGNAETCKLLATLYQPYGEYMLAVIPSLLRWLDE